MGNLPQEAIDHFHGLKAAKDDLAGITVFDNLDRDDLSDNGNLSFHQWTRNEIENYIAYPEALAGYAMGLSPDGPIFEERYRTAMRQCIENRIPKAAVKDYNDEFWVKQKLSSTLDALFRDFFNDIKIYNLMDKTNFHRLATYMPQKLIDREVVEVLDKIVNVSEKAKPVQ